LRLLQGWKTWKTSPSVTDFSDENWGTFRLSPVFPTARRNRGTFRLSPVFFEEPEIFPRGGEIGLQPERFLEMRDRFAHASRAG
jgi:hypothetical protein